MRIIKAIAPSGAEKCIDVKCHLQHAGFIIYVVLLVIGFQHINRAGCPVYIRGYFAAVAGGA